MKIDTFTYNCIGCGKCVTCCPCGCFTLVDNGSCRFVNVVDADLCIGCKLCEQHCPNKVIRIDKTKKDKIMNMWKLRAKFTLHMAGGIGMIALVVGIVMWLWNWLVPSITGWSNINYWQALGLTLLFRFLNGNILPPMFPTKKRGSFEKMKKMSVEERSAFIRRQLSKLSHENIDNEKP
ncbi:hypothetical protein DW712_16190 [Bacteroides intestinalis]|uniref:4Fe-4S ferredoxin-type domain-containing protein n=2 Tax=Bacteroides intestinalis TaxID=329854 RepID=A0A414L640_9BACE|nr:hypothetical protein DW712_16190 [Bacteroides intestinalis]